ncbi:6-bladed beta-propeller [Parabacteroides goldsteinii]|uniref:6-bladed beta-propeller n=1 Tax=Parabacteroides goldsteinii TaxID=328812 RepID=UPI001CCF1FCA|nr:6-bladed beta-propeller [Parabacteroides goldsteinii]UBD73759.1 6-bladed beta-propeller [Parabacteroides goldsteinii]
MKKNILYVLLIFIFIACDLTKEDKKNTVRGDIVSIPITEMETDYGKLSDFAEDIKMIPLEFSGDCILDKVEKIVMSDSCIFIMERYNQKGIYVFDHSGKYLYRVGNCGQGPDEFVDLSDFSLNEEQQLIYLYDIMRKKVLIFSFEGDFIKDIQMNYYADKFEYQDNLFYLYRESPVMGDPAYSLVIKDDKGKTINKYYPLINKSPYIHDCIFRKLDNEILFAEYMRDSVFSVRSGELTPKYFIDYKDKSMSKVDRESILKRTRLPLTVLLECKKMAGIKDIFEINDKVFIKNKHIVIPQFTVYDKKTQKVKTFSHILNDFLFIGLSHLIGQYKDYLISVGPQERLQAAINIGFKVWQEEGLLTAKRAKELTAMIEERFPDRNNIGETNPMIFLLKVKK